MAEAITRYRAMAPEGSVPSNMLQDGTTFRFSPESGFDWAVLVFLPVMVALYLGLALSHALYFRHRVHVLYLQVTIALPALMLLSWVSYFCPRTSPWLNVGARFCEAWVSRSAP